MKDISSHMKKFAITILILMICFSLFSAYTFNRILKVNLHYNLNPTSYEEFIKTNKKSTLPSYSQNIYFSSYAHWQTIIVFLRFEVPADQLETTVASLANELFTSPQNDIVKSKKMDQTVHIPEELSPLLWWNVNDIKKGYSLEEQNGEGYTIWVDSEKNIIYIYYFH